MSQQRPLGRVFPHVDVDAIHDAVHWRGDHAQRELGFGQIQRGARAPQFRFGVIQFLSADHAFFLELALPVDLALRPLLTRLGVFQLRLPRALVDTKQGLTCLHHIAFLHTNPFDRAGNGRGEIDVLDRFHNAGERDGFVDRTGRGFLDHDAFGRSGALGRGLRGRILALIVGRTRHKREAGASHDGAHG